MCKPVTFPGMTGHLRRNTHIERSALEEQALGALLRLSLEPLPLEEFLQQALDRILASVPWLMLLPKGKDSADDVLKQADTAMYRAKEGGRNAIRFFLPSMQRAAEARLQLQTDLRRAIVRQELSLHFQPQAVPSAGLC
jgi:predicted signal transduction protein with EAL and GGDEF domain